MGDLRGFGNLAGLIMVERAVKNLSVETWETCEVLETSQVL